MAGFIREAGRIYSEIFRKKIPENIIMSIRNLKTSGKKVLLVSHELSFTGAPIVLVNIAEILKKNGFDVVVISYREGPLRKRFEEIGIPVFATFGAQYDKSGLEKIIQNFDLVVANTLPVYRTVAHINGLIPLIWFVHEAKAFETSILKWANSYKHGCPPVTDVLKSVKEIFVVSEYSKSVMKKYSDNVYVLHNGVADEYVIGQREPQDKVVFSCIGAVSERKAQDIFVNAVEELPPSYREKAEFNIIGDYSSSFGQELYKKSGAFINWHGAILDRERIKKIYKNTDMVICVSRDDPAPLVVTEAAMFGVPAVISQNVGSDYLIENNISGFVIPTGDAGALKNILIKSIENPKLLIEMGKIARENYLKTSSIERFEENFMRIVDEKLNGADYDKI